MISVLPLKDLSDIKRYFENSNIEYIDNAGCSVAYDGKNEIGYSLYTVEKDSIKILDVSPKNDILLADAVLRSTLFAAANMGIIFAFYNEAIKDIVKKLGFILEDKDNSINFDKLFNSCGH